MKLIHSLLLCIPLFFTSCAAAASVPPDPGGEQSSGKEPVKHLPTVSFDLFDGICATSPDGKYKVCGNPLLKTFTVRKTGSLAGYSLKYDALSKDFTGTMPDGSTITYKPGGKILVTPPPDTGKSTVHPLIE